MSKIINIAQIRNNKIKAQQIEFNLDKDYIELEAKNYSRAEYKELLNKEKERYER